MIERLIGDYLQLVRRGAARATGLGIRTLRRLNAVLDPRTPVEPDALAPDRTVEDRGGCCGAIGVATTVAIPSRSPSRRSANGSRR